MKIILYKNCILTNAYNEVFKNEEILNEYLNSLEKKELDLDDLIVYPRFNDIIVLESNLYDIFEYNYAKIINNDDTNISPFYAFIEKVEIINGLITFSYIQDIWSSFFERWKIRYATLNNTKYPTQYNCDMWELPIPLKPIGAPDFIRLFNNGNDPFPSDSYYGFMHNKEDYKCSLYVELQFYKLSEQGTNNGGTFNYVIYVDSYDTYNDFLQDIYMIINNQSRVNGVKIITKNEVIECEYSIVNMWCIPFNFGLSKYVSFNSFTIVDTLPVINVNDGDYIQFSSPFDKYGWLLKGDNNKYITYDTIPSDFNYNYYGSLTSLTPLSKNGRNQTIQLFYSCFNQDLTLFISLNGTQIDISSLFEIKPNYNVISSDVAQQRNIAYALTKSDLIAQYNLVIAQSGIDYAKSAVNITKGTGQIANGNISGISKIANASLDMLENYATTKHELHKIDRHLMANEERSYKNAVEQVGIIKGYINGWIGFGIFASSDFYNFDDVAKILNETGFNVKTPIDKLIDSIPIEEYIPSNEKFKKFYTYREECDVIALSNIILYGLPNEILNTIYSILNNGVKIWYSSNINKKDLIIV